MPHRFGLQRPVGLAPMPTRSAPMRRRYDKAGVVHAEWFENVLPEMYTQRLAAHRLHDAADLIDVAPLPALPGSNIAARGSLLGRRLAACRGPCSISALVPQPGTKPAVWVGGHGRIGCLAGSNSGLPAASKLSTTRGAAITGSIAPAPGAGFALDQPQRATDVISYHGATRSCRASSPAS